MKGALSQSILVTGGAGYVGSHAVLALKRLGYRVVVVDNLLFGNRDIVERVLDTELIVGDCGDRELLRKIFATREIAAVMHFAATADVSDSLVRPEDYYRNNTANSLTLLEEMLAASIQLFVFSSTAAVYGLPITLPIEEDHSTRPISPYGESKLMTEAMLAALDRAHDFRFVCFRYFNASGADPSGLIGENRTGETHLIPLTLKTALGNSECLSIFGDAYPTPDGTCIRDYVHVCDIARAHVLALQYLISGGTSDTFNLGNGAGYSVKEILKTSEQVSGRRIPTRILPPRLGDPPILVSNSTKANRILGWQPAFPRLDEIIRDAWRWHSKLYSNPENAHSKAH